MASITIREMQGEDEYFVSTCSHVNESDEIDACGRRRLAWLKQRYDLGVRAKVALLDDAHVGFVYIVPIEICPWGPVGVDLAVIPCLWVLQDRGHKGVGQALMAAAEDEARQQERKAVCTVGFTGDFWFMPAAFFERLGFQEVRRQGKAVLLWKPFVDTAEAPEFLERSYEYQPVEGKVVVDLFYNTFCQTSDIEAHRVREVAAEFADRVALNERSADDRQVLLGCGTPRAILVNGEEIFWGYEAPKDGIRDAIDKALSEQ